MLLFASGLFIVFVLAFKLVILILFTLTFSDLILIFYCSDSIFLLLF